MAKASYPCATCGEQVTIAGRNRKDADRLAEWHEQQGHICWDCEQKARAEQNAAAAVENQAAGLPALVGTEKQVAWAETIRKDKLYAAEQFISRLAEVERKDPRAAQLFSTLRNQTAASWWIDNRGYRAEELLKALLRQVDPPAPNLDREAARQAEQEAKAEATVRPDQPRTETVAEVRVNGKTIEVMFPEKREDFWHIIKPEMGFHWTGALWALPCDVTDGTPADRAAETGRHLLAAGFPVRIFDTAIREAMLSGSYQPKHPRWVTSWAPTDRYHERVEKRAFALQWGKQDDLYKAAMKLPRARYSKPFVVVPPEYFDEVLDFVTAYDFRVSPGATALIEEHRALRDKTLVAHVDKPDAPRAIEATGKPPRLEVPEHQEVDDDLRDE